MDPMFSIPLGYETSFMGSRCNSSYTVIYFPFPNFEFPRMEKNEGIFFTKKDQNLIAIDSIRLWNRRPQMVLNDWLIGNL